MGWWGICGRSKETGTATKLKHAAGTEGHLHEVKGRVNRSKEFKQRSMLPNAQSLENIPVSKITGRPRRGAYIAYDVVRAVSKLKSMVRRRRQLTGDQILEEVKQRRRSRAEEYLVRGSIDTQQQQHAGQVVVLQHHQHTKLHNGRVDRASILWHDVKEPVVHIFHVMAGHKKVTPLPSSDDKEARQVLVAPAAKDLDVLAPAVEGPS